MKCGTEPRDRIRREQWRHRHGVKFLIQDDKRVGRPVSFRLVVNFGKGNGTDRRSGWRVSKRSCFSSDAIRMRSALIRPRKLSKADKVVARSWSAPAKASRKAWSRERIAAVVVICRLRSSISFLKTCAPARKRESICARACSRFACRTTRYVTLCRSVKSATKEKRSRLLKRRNRSLRDNLRSIARALSWRESPASNPN